MRWVILIFVQIIPLILFSQSKSEFNNQLLFTISRSKDLDQIEYWYKKDVIKNKSETIPIKINWIKHTKNGKREPLTWIQNKYAYGLNPLNENGTSIEFSFVSYSKKIFVLEGLNSKNTKVTTETSLGKIQITHIHVQLDGGTFWAPKVPRVLIYGRTLDQNLEVVDEIKFE
jgi:hypothetical protein